MEMLNALSRLIIHFHVNEKTEISRSSAAVFHPHTHPRQLSVAIVFLTCRILLTDNRHVDSFTEI